MILDQKIWGPHYWFVLHTIALNYPLHPNEVIKKKYYDFIENLPLFLPIDNMSNNFSKILDDFPVTPYLDSRESFIKWMHFVHNKINISLGIPEKTLEESLSEYYNLYKDDKTILREQLISNKKLFYIILILLLIIISFYIYRL